MNNENLKIAAEIRTDLNDYLKKHGFKEGKDYTITTKVESIFDEYRLTNLVKPLAHLDDDSKFKLKDDVEKFQQEKGENFFKEDTDLFVASDGIDKDIFEGLKKSNNLNVAVEKQLRRKMKDNASGDFNQSIPKAEESEKSSRSSESLNDSHSSEVEVEDQQEPILSMESSGTAKVKKSYWHRVKETIMDRGAQRDAALSAGISVIITGGSLFTWSYCNTQRLDSESKIQKAKRVFRNTFKRPKNLMGMIAVGVLGATLSVLDNARKRE